MITFVIESTMIYYVFSGKLDIKNTTRDRASMQFFDTCNNII